MTALKELQSSFKQHLLKGDIGILPDIVGSDDFTNRERLAVYGNAYYARLIEVLQGDYEAIHTLLGDDEFERLCRAYIDAYPSRYFSLRWFGQHMPAYLRAKAPYSQYEYLGEMATFEWLFTDAFDAADIDIFTESEVASIPAESWPQLKVLFHPSVCWFDYQWNILPVWKAIKDNEQVPVLQKLTNSETCLIWRQGLTTKYRTLEATESLVFKSAVDSKNFSQWCEILMDQGYTSERVPMVAAGALKTWLGLGMIAGIEH